jgi:K+-transporting ATPase c subunit
MTPASFFRQRAKHAAWRFIMAINARLCAQYALPGGASPSGQDHAPKEEHHTEQAQSQQHEYKRKFADDKARIGFEIAERASALAATLPPEAADLQTSPITFAAQYKHRGLAAVFATGTAIFTGQPGVLLVPARTLQVLEKLDIPYQITQP